MYCSQPLGGLWYLEVANMSIAINTYSIDIGYI